MKNLTISFILIISTQIAIAAESSLYDFKWLDDNEKVYVIQNKEHIKAGGLGFDLSLMDSNSSPYQDTFGFSAALTYYFSENWSIDFTYKQYSNEDSADLENLVKAYNSEVKPLIRRIDAAKLIHINWIPFYGKVNTFNKIFFFDWGFGLGMGQFDTAGNYETFNDQSKSITFKEEVDTGFNLKSYVKFFTLSGMTLGFEYNLTGVSTIRNKEGTKETLYFNDVMASVGYIF
jgi:outer membrane beta-barrel protein